MTNRHKTTYPGQVALVCCLVALSGVVFSGCRFSPSNSSPPPTATPLSPVRFMDPVHFVDVAVPAGLHYEWRVAGKRPLTILQTIGNGCACLDYDNDGKLDILLVGPQLALFRGDGQGRFADVTAAAGLARLAGHFLGCAVGDYDNDGWDDVYISGYRSGRLLHNQGGRGFTDVTGVAGLAPQPWGTSCTWVDVDGDGRLDLFVTNYVRFGPEPGIPQLCDSHGVKGACGPRYYQPLKGVLYRNLGQNRFVEANAMLNVASTHGRGLAVASAPLDGAVRPTLAIANDEMPGDLLSPSGQGSAVRYVNTGSASGTSVDRDGNIHGGMGADWGDYDGDGRLDLLIATFQGENKSLYHNDGPGVFSDTSYRTGLAAPTLRNVAFGCKWLDYDNDGWLDLMLTNGHIQDSIHDVDASASYRQATQVFHNGGKASLTFENVSAVAGLDFARPIVGRGLAVGDYDNDGRVDALVVDSEGKPLLLHNESAPVGHWLSVRLEGSKSNRDGIGALLTATVGGRQLVRLCHTDGSYLSASDRRVHFGLGRATAVDALTIRWPSGSIRAFNHLAADRQYTIREGNAALTPG